MKFMQWKNLRIDPTQPDMTIQEKFVAFSFLGVPTISVFLGALALGSKNEFLWATSALFFGMMLALKMMHPKTATTDWKKLFLINGIPVLIVPILMELGAEFWSFVVAATIYFGIRFFYKQTTKTEGA